ncbi:MAG: DUF2335 domain-containing protein [Polyangiaceae bacterium]|nr:DUF2335 domain-containing protein [Polyangiaceae bacterium]
MSGDKEIDKPESIQRVATQDPAPLSSDRPKMKPAFVPPEQLGLPRVGVARIESESYQGPIPPPAMLADYGRVDPGLVDRIVKMAEAEAAHRRAMDKQEHDDTLRAFFRNQDLQRRGMTYGLILGIAGLVAAAYCATIGQKEVAIGIATGALVSLVGTYIYGVHRLTTSSQGSESPKDLQRGADPSKGDSAKQLPR